MPPFVPAILARACGTLSSTSRTLPHGVDFFHCGIWFANSVQAVWVSVMRGYINGLGGSDWDFEAETRAA